MKKTVALLLALAMCLSLCACGGSPSKDHAPTSTPATTEAHSEEVVSTVDVASENNKVYHFGETATTEYFAFTPVFGGFAEEVGNWPDNGYLTPQGKVSGNNPFKASEEKTIMYFSGIVEYLGGSKSNEIFFYTFQVDYDNGYLFDFNAYNCGFSLDQENWEYSSAMTFEPLSSNNTRYVRFCIEVPKVVETNSSAPLLVTFDLNGSKYVYSLTESARTNAIHAMDEELSAAEAAYGEILFDADPDIANAVTEKIQGTWEFDLGLGMIKTVTFEGNQMTAVTTLQGYEMVESGTFVVRAGALLITFETGPRGVMEYTYENGSLELSVYEYMEE